MHDRLARLLPHLGVALVGALAALALLGLTSETKGRVGPGGVAVKAQFLPGGRTVLELPPLGSVTARTHAVPLAFTARVDNLDVEALQTLLGEGDPVDRLEQSVYDDLGPLARKFALRALLAAVLVGALAGAIVPGRRWPHLVVGAVGSAVVVSALLTVAWSGYDAEAFREPQFDGPIERAPSLLQAARRHVEGLDDVRRRLEVLGDRVTDLYSAALGPAAVPGAEEVRILHIADIHSNPVGLEIARRLARGFRVSAVLDTGDLTSFGLPIEARLGELIDDIGVPYLFVPGNHDSDQNRESLAAVGNVQILDDDVVEVGGVRILGVADPTFTASNEMTTEEAAAVKLAVAQDVAELAGLHAPDVLAAHDPALASRVSGQTPLVVAGHVHRRTWRQRGPTLFLTTGSAGATGVDSFMVQTDLAYESQVLTFVQGRLVSVDYVWLTGLAGNFRVERRLVDPPPEPSPEPSPSPSP